MIMTRRALTFLLAAAGIAYAPRLRSAEIEPAALPTASPGRISISQLRTLCLECTNLDQVRAIIDREFGGLPFVSVDAWDRQTRFTSLTSMSDDQKPFIGAYLVGEVVGGDQGRQTVVIVFLPSKRYAQPASLENILIMEGVVAAERAKALHAMGDTSRLLAIGTVEEIDRAGEVETVALHFHARQG